MTRAEILKLTDAEIDKVVKIQGTRFDRKRKYSTSTYNRMKNMFAKGKSVAEIAKALGISYGTVRYNVDEEFRKEFNETRSGAHTGVDKITKEDRAAYKRDIIATRKYRMSV